MQNVARNEKSCSKYEKLPTVAEQLVESPDPASSSWRIIREPLLEGWKEKIQSKVVAQLTPFTWNAILHRLFEVGRRDLLMLEISEEPLRGGGDKNERTAEAENDGKEGKTTSENSLTNRPYSRYPPSLKASFRIDGIKPMSRDISGGKQAMKFGNTRNRRRVCLFY